MKISQRTIYNVNLYEFLGVRPNASVEEIKKTCFMRKSDYYIDQYTSGISDYIEGFLDLIDVADMVLTNKKLRNEYDKSVANKVSETTSEELDIIYESLKKPDEPQVVKKISK